MKVRLFIVSLVLISNLWNCKTTEELPVCDPNKEYIQIDPPACKKMTKPIINCPKTKRLGLPYTNLDEANYRLAIPRCAELFPVSPCLKVFSKMAEHTYRAICGAPDGIGKQEFIDWKDRSR